MCHTMIQPNTHSTLVTWAKEDQVTDHVSLTKKTFRTDNNSLITWIVWDRPPIIPIGHASSSEYTREAIEDKY